MILTTEKIFVFDLDDTLYSERDFEKSGIQFVYNMLDITLYPLSFFLANKTNWIQNMLSYSQVDLSFEQVLNIYQSHMPSISLYDDAAKFLYKLKIQGIEMSLITDGRSITQRNKLKALKIENFFKHIIISEEVNSQKPSIANFMMVMDKKKSKEYVYFADNPKKDFIAPNELGWTSVCLLDRGNNVHEQDFSKSNKLIPQFKINSFDEIIILNEN
jgi:putative hydrolase of the HAD superfamily